jgi:hypothetical protein
MEILYKKIVDTFNANEAVFTERNLPPIRQIDINYGQLDHVEDFEVFLPGIFIGWEIIENNSNEPSLARLDFHLAQDPGANTESFSKTLEAGMEYILMIKTVKYVLNKLRASNTSGLVYAGERPEITPYLRYHVISYQCFIDKVHDSLTGGKTEEVKLTDYTKDFKTKEKADIPLAPDIDTMK